MRLPAEVARRLLARIRRSRMDDELREEIEHHLELRRQQLIDDGADPGEAHYEARRRFGNVGIVREKAFTMSAIPALDSVAHDVRYGLRMINKSRGFSLIAVLSLAVGIGASTTLFSFANSFLFRPLHAADPAELMQVFTSNFEGPSYGSSSYPDYVDFRDRTRIFSGLLAAMRARATLIDGEEPNVIRGELVSGNYFDVLGLKPSLGRFFLPEEIQTPNTHPVIVLSHDAWLRRFNSDPQIVGRTVALNGHVFTVIGVAPARFSGTSIEFAATFFAPVMMQRIISPDLDVLHNRRARMFRVFGRLDDGITLRQGQAALQVLAAQLVQQDPDAWRDRSGRARIITLLPELEARFVGAGPGAVASIVSGVVAAVVVLLGIACVNVATVLLARATTRRKEIAVRLAIGASRRRVVQQLLTECGLLAVAGGLLGLVLTQCLAAAFERFRPADAPPFDLTIDHRILLFSIASSLLTVCLFGLAPALQTTRPDVNAELKETSPMMRMRRWRVGLRDALVIIQVALSLTMLIGASLLLRSYHAGLTEDVGFRREGILSVGVDLSTFGAKPEARTRFYREAVRVISTVAGVEQVVVAALVPLDGSNITTGIELSDAGTGRSTSVDLNIVGAGYFSLMGIPVVRGREFTSSDRAGMPAVALVNETMAGQFWKGDAIGRVFREEVRGAVEIVGIVRDLRHRSFGEAPRPMIYFSADQGYVPRMTLHLRTSGTGPAMGRAVQDLLRELEPAVGLTRVQTMSEHMENATMPHRLGGLAAAASGLLELTLAVMALYGVVAYAVSQRTREIGLRMALGAPARSVLRLIMRDGLVLAGVGLSLGIASALVAGPAIRSFLIGIGTTDPLSFGGSALLLLLVAAAASYVPARRALHVEPSVALRSE